MTTIKTDPVTNLKLPKQPSFFQRSTVDYPNFAGEIGHNGDYVAISTDTAAPNTAAKETFTVIGGYHVEENTTGVGKPVTHELNPGHHFEYKGGGHSHAVDGNSDHSHGDVGNFLTNVFGDTGHGSLKDSYHGVGGVSTVGTGGSGSTEHHTGGNKFIISSGDLNQQHDGNLHQSVNGNHVLAANGSQYQMINGETGLYVNNGNYDTSVNNGKMRLNASQNITISSSTQITLQVGSSSIVITSSSVTINSPTIITNGNTYLGGVGGVAAAKQGTIDTGGYTDVGGLATKVFVT